MRRSSDPPELQRQQRPEGVARRDHPAARHAAVADGPVEVEPDEVGDEREQPAELGAQAPRRQVEFPDVGDRGGGGPQGSLPLAGRPARQLADAVPAEDAPHGRRSGGNPLLHGLPADLPDRERGGPAELQDPPVPPQPEGLLGVRPRARPALGEERGQVGVAAQPRAEVAEGAEAVAEALRDRPGLQALEEVGPEGLVLEMGAGFGLAEEFGQVGHDDTGGLKTCSTIMHDTSRRRPELHGHVPEVPTDAAFWP